MSDPVKLKGKLPGTREQSSLFDTFTELAEHPRARHVWVIIGDVMSTKVDHLVDEDGQAVDVKIPTIRILRIEELDGADADQARVMMTRAADRRLGRDSLLRYDPVIRHLRLEDKPDGDDV